MEAWEFVVSHPNHDEAVVRMGHPDCAGQKQRVSKSAEKRRSQSWWGQQIPGAVFV